MNKKVTVIILLDALRWDYFDREKSIFTSNLKNKSTIAELVPTFGFEPDGAFLSGVYPEKSNGGMHYWYSPDTSVFKWTRKYSNLFKKFPISSQKYIRFFIRLINFLKESEKGKKYFSFPSKIPFEYLNLFDPVHDKLMFEKDLFDCPTIFDICRNKKINWDFIGYPTYRGTLDKGIYKIINSVNKGNSFVFGFFGELDRIGHKFGPDSIEINNLISHIDNSIQILFNELEKKYDFDFILFGDHGMVQVNKELDIQSNLNKLICNPGKDYNYFLDSTFARFWFNNDDAKTEIYNLLESLDGGSIINQPIKDHYSINYPHNKFGDIIYWMNDGNIILPNFFQGSQSIEGMHGYPDNVRDNNSFFMHYNSVSKTKKTLGKTSMIDIFEIIKNTIN